MFLMVAIKLQINEASVPQQYKTGLYGHFSPFKRENVNQDNLLRWPKTKGHFRV